MFWEQLTYLDMCLYLNEMKCVMKGRFFKYFSTNFKHLLTPKLSAH